MLTSDFRPLVRITKSDYRRLSALAISLDDEGRVAGQLLRAELDRALIVDEAAMPANVVRVGSWVRFRQRNGTRSRWATLTDETVHQNPDSGLLFIGTTTGAALLGLPEGAEFIYVDETGHAQSLIVEKVVQRRT